MCVGAIADFLEDLYSENEGGTFCFSCLEREDE